MAFHPSIFLDPGLMVPQLIVAQTEMGNGVRTSLPRIVADELDADWSRVKVIQGDGDERYGSQDTDGSHSVREFSTIVASRSGMTALDAGLELPRQQWGGVPEAYSAALSIRAQRACQDALPTGRSAMAISPH